MGSWGQNRIELQILSQTIMDSRTICSRIMVGSELIGDGASLSSLKMLVNYPDNRIIDQQCSVANDPSSVFDFENWDNYLVANLTPEEIAEVYNNTFIPNWVAAPDRFYPDVSAFRFVPEPPEPPTSPIHSEHWDRILSKANLA